MLLIVVTYLKLVAFLIFVVTLIYLIVLSLIMRKQFIKLNRNYKQLIFIVITYLKGRT